MKKIIITSLILHLASAQAVEVGFDEVWQMAKENSLSGKSYSAKLEAQEIAKNRAAKHWYPRLYIDSSVYSTNDPAYSFMGKLNQGAIQTSDLMTNSMAISNKLNNPDTKQYQTHTLGMWVPLYEGGMKSHLQKSKEYEYAATSAEVKHNDAKLYAEIAKLYGIHMVAVATEEEINKVDLEISEIMNNYTIGDKKNPLGRSGLLGLRSLKMRIDAEKEQLGALKSSIIDALRELTGNTTLTIKKVDSRTFINKNLIGKTSANKDSSYELKALKEMSRVAKEHQKAARAYYLPQVGVFAQNNTYNGDRDTNSAQTVGLSVKWEFFNLTNWKAPDEAGAFARSAEAYAKAREQQELLQNQASQSQEKVIENNLVRLDSALNDYEEQTRINYRLFKNGIINVLQMSEVLNRKIDIIKFRDQAHNQYLLTWSNLYITKNNNLE